MADEGAQAKGSRGDRGLAGSRVRGDVRKVGRYTDIKELENGDVALHRGRIRNRSHRNLDRFQGARPTSPPLGQSRRSRATCSRGGTEIDARRVQTT